MPQDRLCSSARRLFPGRLRCNALQIPASKSRLPNEFCQTPQSGNQPFATFPAAGRKAADHRPSLSHHCSKRPIDEGKVPASSNTGSARTSAPDRPLDQKISLPVRDGPAPGFLSRGQPDQSHPSGAGHPSEKLYLADCQPEMPPPGLLRRRAARTTAREAKRLEQGL